MDCTTWGYSEKLSYEDQNYIMFWHLPILKKISSMIRRVVRSVEVLKASLGGFAKKLQTVFPHASRLQLLELWPSGNKENARSMKDNFHLSDLQIGRVCT